MCQLENIFLESSIIVDTVVLYSFEVVGRSVEYWEYLLNIR
jgi:hypothetical protein